MPSILPQYFSSSRLRTLATPHLYSKPLVLCAHTALFASSTLWLTDEAPVQSIYEQHLPSADLVCANQDPSTGLHSAIPSCLNSASVDAKDAATDKKTLSFLEFHPWKRQMLTEH